MNFKIQVGDESFIVEKDVNYIIIYKVKTNGGFEEVDSYDYWYDDDYDINDDNVDIDIIVNVLKSFKAKRLEVQRRYPNPAAR